MTIYNPNVVINVSEYFVGTFGEQGEVWECISYITLESQILTDTMRRFYGQFI